MRFGQRHKRAGAEQRPRLAPNLYKRPKTDPTLSERQPRQHTDAIEIKAPLTGSYGARRCGRGVGKATSLPLSPGRVKRLEAKRIALEPVPSLTIARDRETVRTRSQKIFDNLHCTWALKPFCAVWLFLTCENPRGDKRHNTTFTIHPPISDRGHDRDFLISINCHLTLVATVNTAGEWRQQY